MSFQNTPPKILGPVMAAALLLLLPAGSANAQYKMSTREYVSTYKNMAIQEMRQFGIPASITLAQGLLESGNGGSTLAVKGNNHFGIKCRGDWDGRKIYHDDDEKGECFRRYRNAEHSYRDHSKFLRESKRYASLFELQPTDYRGWAYGLKAAGYATNPRYAELLISLIEKNDLHKYDTRDGRRKEQEPASVAAIPATERHPTQYNRNLTRYIITRQGDSFASVAEEFSLRERTLLKINDLRGAAPLAVGTRLYVEPKHKKAAKGTPRHTIGRGESYHSISQEYGITLRSLQRMNPVTTKTVPEVGRTLRVR